MTFPFSLPKIPAMTAEQIGDQVKLIVEELRHVKEDYREESPFFLDFKWESDSHDTSNLANIDTIRTREKFAPLMTAGVQLVAPHTETGQITFRRARITWDENGKVIQLFHAQGIEDAHPDGIPSAFEEAKRRILASKRLS